MRPFTTKIKNVLEEYYSAGAVEVAETNFLQMTERTVDGIGQFYVRSKCFVL
jgi:hypothetical protein